MNSEIKRSNAEMEYLTAPFKVSRIALGTWAIGGWMWGGTDEAESIRTVHEAVDRGITLIDTAPAYGFGRSEEIVGRVLAEGGRRKQVLIATKERGTAIPQCQQSTHSQRDRGFARASADRCHRHLSGALA